MHVEIFDWGGHQEAVIFMGVAVPLCVSSMAQLRKHKGVFL